MSSWVAVLAALFVLSVVFEFSKMLCSNLATSVLLFSVADNLILCFFLLSKFYNESIIAYLVFAGLSSRIFRHQGFCF